MSKIVFITGISRGIGLATAEFFLKNGFVVIGTSTSGKSPIVSPNLVIYELNLSSPESIKFVAEKIIFSDRRIDILINNAGTGFDNRGDNKVAVDNLRKTLEVNLIGTIDLTERLLDIMNDGGHIINISSVAGSLAESRFSSFPSYKISKTALNMYTRILAAHLAGKIVVSSVHPGWVKTDLGGEGAEIEPQEAAEDIYNFALSRPETGQFWFKGKKIPW